MATIDLTIFREIWLSGTLMRFWSYRVATVTPAGSTILVCWASGSALSFAGSDSTVCDKDLAPMPRTPAKGIARPATTTPITAATAAMTARCEATRDAGRRSPGGTDMVFRVRDGHTHCPFPAPPTSPMGLRQ